MSRYTHWMGWNGRLLATTFSASLDNSPLHRWHPWMWWPASREAWNKILPALLMFSDEKEAFEHKQMCHEQEATSKLEFSLRLKNMGLLLHNKKLLRCLGFHFHRYSMTFRPNVAGSPWIYAQYFAFKHCIFSRWESQSFSSMPFQSPLRCKENVIFDYIFIWKAKTISDGQSIVL